MPRTRADVARDEKVGEIVDAARSRLLDGGYATLSVVDIARELGVAQNAIYWYFPTKDHLFVAAIEQILHDILSRKPRSGTTIDKVLWFAERLNEFQHLRVTMRDRAADSEVVAAFDRDVTALFRFMLAGSLPEVVHPDDLDDTVDTVFALCEGILLRDIAKAERRRLIRFGYQRLTARTDGSRTRRVRVDDTGLSEMA